MQPLFSKSILPFYKKHTTFLKRGRMVVFGLLLNRCWKQCIHPKIDTVVLKKTLDVSKKTLDVFFKTTVCVKTCLGDAVKTAFKWRFNSVLMAFNTSVNSASFPRHHFFKSFQSEQIIVCPDYFKLCPSVDLIRYFLLFRR